MIRQKTSTDKWVERSVEDSTGLYCHWTHRRMNLVPVEGTPTLQTLGKFLNNDLLRWQTWEEMRRMIAAKGWNKGFGHKMAEYAAQYKGGDVPLWFRVWDRFTNWMTDAKESPRPEDVRMSFGWQSTGYDCFEENLHPSRIVILEKNGHYFLAVMMKEGWWGWSIIQKRAIPGEESYNRIILSRGGGCEWVTTSASMISELVRRKQMCLFEIEADDVFRAVTGPENKFEKYAHISRRFEFWYRSDPKLAESDRFYMTWHVTYNPDKKKSDLVEKNNPRILEIFRERNFAWASRNIEVSDVAEAENAARWVVENDGSVVLPADCTDELRFAVMRALFFVTFPDRPITAKGGLLNGYQLPGRMLVRSQKGVRGANISVANEKTAGQRKQMLDDRRAYVVQTLLGRAKRVLSERNALAEDEVGRLLDSVGCAETLANAAQSLGLFEKQKLSLFTTGEATLPDLSLAVAFEQKLGLESPNWKPKRLVQTTRIKPVEECRNYRRETFTRTYPIEPITGKRKLRGRRGGWIEDRRWIARDDTGWYLIAYAKDCGSIDKILRFNGEGVEIKAMRFVSDSLRARTNMRIETKRFEYNALMKFAFAGHVGVWRVDVKNDGQFWRDLWSEKNCAPCSVVAKLGIEVVGTQVANATRDKRAFSNVANDGFASANPTPQLENAQLASNVAAQLDSVEGSSQLAAKGKREVLVVEYTVGARFKRDGRKTEGREINAYLDAWPEDAEKPRCGGFREAIEKDGILVAPRRRMPELIELAKYVVTDDGLKGYQIWDRVFWDDGSGERKFGRSEITTFFKKYGMNKDMLDEFKQLVESDEIFKKCEDLNADRLRDTQKEAFSDVARPLATSLREAPFGRATLADARRIPTARVESSSSVAPTPQSKNALSASKRTDAPSQSQIPIPQSLIEREFGRIVVTGTMGWRRQIRRPAHELAVGIWLARLGC